MVKATLAKLWSQLRAVRWGMLLWAALLPVGVWLLGAPDWVAAILAIWILYKEVEIRD